MKTSNEAIAEDLTQDVFYQASKSIQSYRGEAALSTWLFHIAQNLLKKYYRSKKYENTLLTRLTDHATEKLHTTEQYVQLKESVQELLCKLEQLEQPLKDIMLLRIVGELSFKEIGDIVGESENYVRVAFHRQKVKLKREGGAI